MAAVAAERIVAVQGWRWRTVVVVVVVVVAAAAAAVLWDSGEHCRGRLSLSLDWAAGMTSVGFQVECSKIFDLH